MKLKKLCTLAALFLACALFCGCTSDILSLLEETDESEYYDFVIFPTDEEKENAEDAPGEVKPEEVIPSEKTDEEAVESNSNKDEKDKKDETAKPEEKPEEKKDGSILSNAKDGEKNGDVSAETAKTEEVTPKTEPDSVPSDADVKTEPDTKPESGKKTEEHTTSPPAEPTIDINGSYTKKEDVALYLHLYRKLPKNFITKAEAEKEGWTGGGLSKGRSIGGSYFGNYEGNLPKGKGIEYHECDIDTMNKKSRGAKRLVWSNKGAIYYTDDHYETFTLLYEEWEE